MRYKIKRDLWISLIPLGIFVFLIIMYTIVPLEEKSEILIAIGINALVVLPIYFMGYYELHENRLEMKIAVFKKEINYSDMVSFKPKKSFRQKSTFKRQQWGFSNQRIEIEYKTKNGKTRYVEISPVDRENFIMDLERNTGIRTEKEY